MAKKKKQAQPKSVFKHFITFILVFIALAAVLSLYNAPFEKPEEVGINQVAEYIKNDQVKEIIVSESTSVKIQLNDEAGTIVMSQKEASESLPTLLSSYGVTTKDISKTNIKVEGKTALKFFLTEVLPILLPIGFIILFLWIIMRQMQGSNNRAMMFGQTKAQAHDAEKQKQKTTFKDVAGAKEAKEELSEVVDFLKQPKKFTALGAKIPKGVLLMGSPGTGKTLMARAVAGEANVPFFHITGSEFVEMFVGVGASRVRDIFRKAKKAAPSILFIDEIDAVGRQRGAGLGGSHDEREQTLNQILTEMDGFEPDTGVIVIAATNRPDVLDPALLRPGRFDRRVVIELPDLIEREAILKVHAKDKMIDSSVKLKVIAQRTIGFSGADLMSVLNEAAIFAARHNKKKITMYECLEAVDKVMMGPQRKSAKFTDNERRITAYHEAGHALMAHFAKDSDPVHKVTIVPRGRAGGYTMKLPEEDRRLHSRKELLADIAVSLGGHAAEILTFKDITTGASSDLNKATKVARQLITQFGMSDKLGPRTYGEVQEMIFLGKEIHEQRDYSEKTAQAIDNEIDSIIAKQYTFVKDTLTEHKKELDAVAESLLDVETLERAEFEAIMKGKTESNSAKIEDKKTASAE